MDDNELNGTEIQSVEISKPVKWLGYESIRTEHATNLVVQQYNGEFILYFFEVQPPFTTGTPQEQAAQFQEVPHVEAKCVAKIVMSPPNTANATNFLIEQLNNFEAMLQNAKRDQENAK